MFRLAYESIGPVRSLTVAKPYMHCQSYHLQSKYVATERKHTSNVCQTHRFLSPLIYSRYQTNVQTNKTGRSGSSYKRNNIHSSKQRSFPVLWCILGFSLNDFLGRNDDEEEKETEEDSELIIMIKRGILAFYNKEYDKSESLLHLALKYAQELADAKAITYIFDVLANLAYQRNDFEKAEKLFKSVLQRYASDGGDLFSNEFVAVSLKLAHCHAARGDIENAIKGYHYCIASQAEKLQILPPSSSSIKDEASKAAQAIAPSDAVPVPSITPDDTDTLILYAMSLEQYSSLVMSLGQYPISRLYLQEALSICLKVNGTEHLQTAILRNGIGAILAREGKFTEAIKEIEFAIEIAKQCLEKSEEEAFQQFSLINFFFGSKEPEKKVGAIPNINEENALSNLAVFYINLGTVKLLNRELKSARHCCKEGERIARKARDHEAIEEATKCLQTVRDAFRSAKTRDTKE